MFFFLSVLKKHNKLVNKQIIVCSLDFQSVSNKRQFINKQSERQFQINKPAKNCTELIFKTNVDGQFFFNIQLLHKTAKHKSNKPLPVQIYHCCCFIKGEVRAAYGRSWFELLLIEKGCPSPCRVQGRQAISH